MVGNVNGVGFAPTNNTAFAPKNDKKTPLDVLQERVKIRQMIKEEMRFKELSAKEARGEALTKAEEIELKYLKIARAAESIADNLEPKISYVA